MSYLKPEPGKTTFKVFAGLIIMTVSSLTGVYAQDALDVWQLNALHNPGQELLRAEAKGRITIFDGIDNSDVEKALDEQFDRIGHMMFIRTRHQQEDGSLDAKDDDC